LDLTDVEHTDSNTLRWSDEMFRIAGFQPRSVEVSNELFFSLVPLEEQESIKSALASAIQKGGQYSIIHRLIRPDGDVRVVQELAQIVTDDSKRPLKVVGTAHDITEVKKTEEQLLWKTAFFEAQVNSSLDGIIVVDSAGQKVLQNQQMVDLWNIPTQIAEEGDHQRRLKWIKGQVNEPEKFLTKAEHLYAHPAEVSRDELSLLNGKYIDRYTAPVVGQDGKYYGRIWSYRDITERKLAEGRLLLREEQLRLYTEYSPAAIAMFDRDMKYLVVSRGWMEAYHLGDRSIIGLSYYEVFSEVPLRWKEIHRRCLEGAVEKCEEDPFPRADGTETWLRWEVRPWRQADDSIGGIVMFSEDITKRKQAEDARRTCSARSIGRPGGGEARRDTSSCRPGRA
jgi:PAS domain S-box-containing protein